MLHDQNSEGGFRGNCLVKPVGLASWATDRIDWQAAPRVLPNGDEEIFLFRLRLDLPAARLKQMGRLLSPDERERAGRFHFARDRRRYWAGRGQLREILGALTGTDASELTFSYNARGKPKLTTPKNAPSWHFNLAHADSLALVSVTRAGKIGVDLERIRPLGEAEWIVENLFSKSDRAWWNSLPPGERTRAFFLMWTLKEAYVKAMGQGLGGTVNQIQPDDRTPTSAGMASASDDWGIGWDWRFRPLYPDTDYVASVIVRDPEKRVNRMHYWEWAERSI